MSRFCKHCPRKNLTDADFYSTRNVCKQCTIKRNNARTKARIAAKACVDCPAPAADGFARCEACKKAHRDRYHANRVEHAKTAKERRRRLKLAAFNAYGGPHCACCKERHLEFLSIDHIEQDGATHREKLLAEFGWKSNRSAMCGSTFYAWLKRQDYPPGFRVLCMNCNFSISKFGYCPHGGLAHVGAPGKLEAAVSAQNEVLQ